MLVVSAAAFGASALTTGVMLAAARRWSFVDVPNERSAHRVATPTLGGVGLVTGVWAGIATGIATQILVLADSVVWALLVATAVILLAILDEFGSGLSVAQKLLLQLACATAWLAFTWPLPATTLPWIGDAGWTWVWTWVWAGGGIVVLMNVYNFMDGIDGLSAAQATSVGFWLAACLSALDSNLAPLPLAIAAAAIGFLPYNRPPARIFMGDVGSLFLGFIVAATAILAATEGVPLWVSSVLLGAYLYDTGYTLARRAWRRENLLRAHSDHLYQRLLRLGWSHGGVDAGMSAVNLMFGGGAYLTLLVNPTAGVALIVAAAIVMLVATIWIESRTPGASPSEEVM